MTIRPPLISTDIAAKFRLVGDGHSTRSRTVAELRELQELTGDADGAQRVAWTDTWVRAQDWMAGKLDGLEMEVDEAGNQWWTLPGDSERTLLIGGHIDSVPNGGWLDGALNVVAGSR